MLDLGNTPNKEAVYLLQPLNYTHVYNKLSTLLPAEAMRILAKPEPRPSETAWSAQVGAGAQTLPDNQLTAEQRDTLADELEVAQAKIIAALAQHKELASVAAVLFTIPNEKAIRAVVEQGQIQPVLVQWGCASVDAKNTADPLHAFLQRPRETSAPVTVKCSYTDGGSAPDKKFMVRYLGQDSREKANSEGFYHRGRCRIGSQFSICDDTSGQFVLVQEFTVAKGAAYEVDFPYLTDLRITVRDQKGRPVEKEQINMQYQGARQTLTSDEGGEAILQNLEAGQELSFSLEAAGDTPTTVHKLTRQDNNVILVKHVPLLADLNILVTDEAGMGLGPDRHLKVVTADARTFDCTTNAQGQATVSKLSAETTVTVADILVPTAKAEVNLQEGSNEFTLVIPAVLVRQVRVRLIDRKNQPVEGAQIDFKYKKGTKTLTTDKEGICILESGELSDKEKVKTIIRLPAGFKKRKR